MAIVRWNYNVVLGFGLLMAALAHIGSSRMIHNDIGEQKTMSSEEAAAAPIKSCPGHRGEVQGTTVHSSVSAATAAAPGAAGGGLEDKKNFIYGGIGGFSGIGGYVGVFPGLGGVAGIGGAAGIGGVAGVIPAGAGLGGLGGGGAAGGLGGGAGGLGGDGAGGLRGGGVGGLGGSAESREFGGGHLPGTEDTILSCPP